MSAMVSVWLPTLWGTIALIVAVFFVLRFLVLVMAADCDLRTRVAAVDGSLFHGRVAWITGATGGLGRALAQALARQGALLILSSRDQTQLDKLAKSLPCPSSQVFTIPLDFNTADTQSLHQVASYVSTVFGRLDFLFNNAGVTTRTSALSVTQSVIDTVLRVNFLTPVTIARACLPALTSAGLATTATCHIARPSVIVNTLSVAALFATPLRAPYSAAKAASAAYFDCLRLELNQLSSKGYIDSDHNNNSDNDHDHDHDHDHDEGEVDVLRRPVVRIVNVFPGSIKTDAAVNALTEDGSCFGKSDSNVINGLDPHRVADRILAAVSANVDRAIIARPKEMMMTRLALWFPSLWPWLSTKLVSTSRNFHSY